MTLIYETKMVTYLVAKGNSLGIVKSIRVSLIRSEASISIEERSTTRERLSI